MIRVNQRQERQSGTRKAPARERTRPRTVSAPAVEALEGRRLLSLYLGPSKNRPVVFDRALYQITLTGPGLESVGYMGAGRNREVAINLTGTTSQSQLSITQKSVFPGFGTTGGQLPIGRINVQSGQLGGISALGTANLLGAITPLQGAVQTIQFNSLGPNAQVNVPGGVGTFQVNTASLGPNGLVDIGGNVSGSFSVGQLNLNGGKVLIGGSVTGGLDLGGLTVQQGGQFLIGGDVSAASSMGAVVVNGGRVLVTDDVTAPLTMGSLDVSNAGQFIVGGDLSGGLQVAGDATVAGSGLFQVGGNLGNTASGTSSIGTLVIDEGKLLIGQDVSGPLTIGSMTVTDSGQFTIGKDIPDGLDVTTSATVSDGGLFQVGHDMGGLNVGRELDVESSGKLLVGQDVTGAVSVGSGVSLSSNGLLSIGRDLLGGASINGNLSLDSGGSLAVGRDLDTLSVNGNVTFTPSAGTIDVGGNLNNLTITGIYQGRNNLSMSSPELIVGSDLTNFAVSGTKAGQGSISDANIAVTKSIVGLDVAHGIFNSLITAGVLIENGTVGPDGIDAVFDSQVIAGQEILNFEINGNVHSDYVTNPNPTGLPTRIIAGEDRQGDWVNDSQIDKFQITGALMDSVVAASIQPNGGDGTLPPIGYGSTRTQSDTPGDGGNDTYDAPAGYQQFGTGTGAVVNDTYTPVVYVNGVVTGTAYNTALDPTIDDNILGGAINPSFSTGSSSSSTTTTIPISESTVLGGVISTSHGSNPDAYDFAGFFAADTQGVFVGTLPQSSSTS